MAGKDKGSRSRISWTNPLPCSRRGITMMHS
jgi:hypothetical protein